MPQHPLAKMHALHHHQVATQAGRFHFESLLLTSYSSFKTVALFLALLLAPLLTVDCLSIVCNLFMMLRNILTRLCDAILATGVIVLTY